MTATALATFYRQLATMQDAGLPAARCLTVLTEQGSGVARRLAARLLVEVRAGRSLTDAMARHPRVFPAFHVHLLAAGERCGKLDALLVRLAVELEQGARLRGELLTRSLYPLIVLHLAVLIQSVVTYFQRGVGPAAQQLATGFVLLYGAAATVWLLWRLVRDIPPLRLVLDSVLYHIPILHGVLHHLGTARFARIAEAMYTAGLGMPESIETAALASGNAVLQRRLRRAVPMVRAGGNAAQALAATGAFTPLVNGLIHTGAESGRLDDMLRRVAEQSEFEAGVAIERLGKFIPVLAYLLIMAWVASLVMSLFSGYIEMINELSE